MIAAELIAAFKANETAFHNIDGRLPNTEFMAEWERLEAQRDELREQGCEAIYQATKHVNSKDTIFQVYRHTLDSFTLEWFATVAAARKIRLERVTQEEEA